MNNYKKMNTRLFIARNKNLIKELLFFFLLISFVLYLMLFGHSISKKNEEKRKKEAIEHYEMKEQIMNDYHKQIEEIYKDYGESPNEKRK